MNWFALEPTKKRWSAFLPVSVFLLLLCALPAVAKVAVDFDPTRDFSRYKTFAYIGGQEQLPRLQLNPDQLSNQIHRSVVRELTKKGLREVQLQDNPDLVVRYWVETQNETGVGYGASWATYGTYWTGHWNVMYTIMHTTNMNEGTIGIELVDAKLRTLAWRMYATEKIIHTDPDKIWKAADNNIKKGFKGYQPSAKDIAAKKAQWEKEDAAKKSSQP